MARVCRINENFCPQARRFSAAILTDCKGKQRRMRTKSRLDGMQWLWKRLLMLGGSPRKAAGRFLLYLAENRCTVWQQCHFAAADPAGAFPERRRYAVAQQFPLAVGQADPLFFFRGIVKDAERPPCRAVAGCGGQSPAHEGLFQREKPDGPPGWLRPGRSGGGTAPAGPAGPR